MAKSEDFEATPPRKRPPQPGRRPRRRQEEDDDEDDYESSVGDEVVSTIIPYKNAKALIAYYLGVFSLIPCVGLLLGPPALILGILGLGYVKQHPTAKGTGHAIAGIVLGAITTLGNWGGVLFVLIGALLG